MSTTLAELQAAWPAVTATALALPALGLLIAQRIRQRDQRSHFAALHTLDYLLTLIQKLQRHRALGGRGDTEALQQRSLLANELDRLWSDWASHFPDETALPAAWPTLRRDARDFDSHCRLIDRLLAAMELTEQRIATNGGRAPGYGERCRVIEDLGQLRGLSVRAATQSPANGSSRCPVQLEVPLRYLCLRLSSGNQKQAAPEVHNALREIEQRLLQRRGPTLTAADCFALLTPLIDRALDRLRSELKAAATPEKAGRSPMSAAGVPIWSTMP